MDRLNSHWQMRVIVSYELKLFSKVVSNEFQVISRRINIPLVSLLHLRLEFFHVTAEPGELGRRESQYQNIFPTLLALFSFFELVYFLLKITN